MRVPVDNESLIAGAGARARAGAGTGAGVGVGVGTLQYTFRTLWPELAGVEIHKVRKGANRSTVCRECTNPTVTYHIFFSTTNVYIRAKPINYIVWESYMYMYLDIQICQYNKLGWWQRCIWRAIEIVESGDAAPNFSSLQSTLTSEPRNPFVVSCCLTNDLTLLQYNANTKVV